MACRESRRRSGDRRVDGRADHASHDGVGAFLMSEFLGVPYWTWWSAGSLSRSSTTDRSPWPSICSACLLPREAIVAPKVSSYNQVKTSIFFLAVAFLMVVMERSAWENCSRRCIPRPSCSCCCSSTSLLQYLLKDPAVAQETFLGNVRLSIETHADMTSYLTLLLATSAS